jgi:hypothetical protein
VLLPQGKSPQTNAGVVRGTAPVLVCGFLKSVKKLNKKFLNL